MKYIIDKICEGVSKYNNQKNIYGFAKDSNEDRFFFNKYSFRDRDDIMQCNVGDTIESNKTIEKKNQLPVIIDAVIDNKTIISYYRPGYNSHLYRFWKLLKPNSKEKEVLDSLKRILYITKIGKFSMDRGEQFQFAFAGATEILKRYIRGQHEFLIVFSHFDNQAWQARSIKAEREIRKLKEVKERNLIPNFYILISNAKNLKAEIDESVKGKPMSALIPFTFDEILSCDKPKLIKLFLSRFSEYYFEYNMLDESSAIEEDRLLFGDRGKIADAIVERCMRDSNCGIFGLRRSGKTSVLKAALRRFELHQIKYVFIESRSVLEPASSWQYALFCISKKIREKVLNITQNAEETLEEYEKRLKLNRSLNDYKNNGTMSFVEDVNLYCRNEEHFIIAIDEIELITYNTASNTVWKDLDSYCSFWSALRDCGCSLILCGVNSTINESSTVSYKGISRDNPMYERIANCSDSLKTYLPPFTDDQTKHMINTLGGFSNIGFINVYSSINKEFGGQPYAIRQFCAYVYEKVKNQRGDLTYQVSQATIDNLINQFHCSSKGISLYDTILQHIQIYYKEEYNLLIQLALTTDQELVMSALKSQTLDHLIKYGLIEYDYSTNYITFRINAIKNHIRKNVEKRPEDMNNDERRRYIQDCIVKIERALKNHIKTYYQVNGKEAECRKQIIALNNKDSIDKNTCDFDDLFNHNKVIIYFSDLRKMIVKNWTTLGSKFQSKGMDKNRFDFYMKDLNAGRTDADHYDPEVEDDLNISWEITDELLSKFRVAKNELDNII